MLFAFSYRFDHVAFYKFNYQTTYDIFKVTSIMIGFNI